MTTTNFPAWRRFISEIVPLFNKYKVEMIILVKVFTKMWLEFKSVCTCNQGILAMVCAIPSSPSAVNATFLLQSLGFSLFRVPSNASPMSLTSRVSTFFHYLSSFPLESLDSVWVSISLSIEVFHLELQGRERLAFQDRSKEVKSDAGLFGLWYSTM